jgi:hypothetical protein
MNFTPVFSSMKFCMQDACVISKVIVAKDVRAVVVPCAALKACVAIDVHVVEVVHVNGAMTPSIFLSTRFLSSDSSRS